jgi:hypothetical protein
MIGGEMMKQGTLSNRNLVAAFRGVGVLALALLLIPWSGVEIAAATENPVVAPEEAPASAPAEEARTPAPPETVQLLLDGNAAWLRPTPTSLSYTFTMEQPGTNSRYEANVTFSAPDAVVIAVKDGKTYTVKEDDSYDTRNQADSPELTPLLTAATFYGPFHAARQNPNTCSFSLVREESLGGREAFVIEIRRRGPPTDNEMQSWNKDLRRKATRSKYEYEFLPVEKSMDGEKRVVIEVRALHEEGPDWQQIQAALKENPAEIQWGGLIISGAVGDFHGENIPLIYINNAPDAPEKSPITSMTFHGGIDNRTKNLVLGEGERAVDEAEYERLKNETPEPRLFLPLRIGCGVWRSWYGYMGSSMDIDRVWMDKTTGVLIREEGYRDGELHYLAEYGDYEELPSGSLVPKHVKVTLPKTGFDKSGSHPWVFDMKFSTHAGKTWIMDEITNRSAKENSEVTARVSDVVVE